MCRFTWDHLVATVQKIHNTYIMHACATVQEYNDERLYPCPKGVHEMRLSETFSFIGFADDIPKVLSELWVGPLSILRIQEIFLDIWILKDHKGQVSYQHIIIMETWHFTSFCINKNGYFICFYYPLSVHISNKTWYPGTIELASYLQEHKLLVTPSYVPFSELVEMSLFQGIR